MTAYYNDNDPKVCAWLRELIKEGLIADGEVDERSIADVRPSDLLGFSQCHFFAGIGGWSYALRLAGWPDDEPVWTGSCPCQPFSVAGKGRGDKDERHLWPELRRLIAECRPPVVFGEQVASKAGRGWIAGVRADLEAMGYGVGAADLCAAGVGAPHIRQRLYWVAYTGCERDERRRESGELAGAGRDAEGQGLQRERCGDADCDCRADGGMALTDGRDSGTERLQRGGEQRQQPEDGGSCRLAHAMPTGRPEGRTISGRRPSPWGGSILIPCADGKARRIEPTIQPLAHGVPGRVGLLRGAGNAIVPQVAAEFVMAYAESIARV
ncbi:MAG: DNA cytosine methyltransferase [Dehalococcoidia bacterium]|nr:DNA cytosine methyltransferase [Dehalococcoidia bacterium]